MQTYAPNESSYDPADVPELPDASRFELGKNPSGFDVQPTQAVADNFAILLSRLGEAAEPMIPKRVSCKLFYAGKDSTTGQWSLYPRGAVTAVPTVAPKRHSRFGKVKETEGAILDRLFFDGGEGIRDDAIFEALLAWCERTQPSAAVARKVNDLVAHAILLRCGITLRDIRPDQLPRIGDETGHTLTSQ
jgi:hypothetical protein